MDRISILMNKLNEITRNFDNIEAKIIDISTVETGMWTLFKCKYGCTNYNKSLGCPPFTPTAIEMKEALKSYSTGLLIKSKDDMKIINETLLDLEYLALELEFFKAFALGAGRCRICETCNLNQCLHPKTHRPSMEACGIDVQTTAKNNGFEQMTGFENGKKFYYCYGLLLID